MDADYDDLRDILFQVRSSFSSIFLEWRSELCRGTVYIYPVIYKNRRKRAKE